MNRVGWLRGTYHHIGRVGTATWENDEEEDASEGSREQSIEISMSHLVGDSNESPYEKKGVNNLFLIVISSDAA